MFTYAGLRQVADKYLVQDRSSGRIFETPQFAYMLIAMTIFQEYPKETRMREANKYAESFIKEKRALGELDHPDSSVVNLNNVSHNVLDMSWQGNDLVGKVEVLGTPSGNILKELFKSGIRLGISSRGMGSVKEVMREGDNTLEVQPDFELIAFDFVSNPSTHGAFLSPVNESKGSNIQVDKYAKVNKIITDIIKDF